MLIKLLRQCLAPLKYSDVYCYCFLCFIDCLSQMFVSLFSQLSGKFFWKVLITFCRYLKWSVLRECRKWSFRIGCLREIAIEFKMKAYFSCICLYLSYNFGIDRWNEGKYPIPPDFLSFRFGVGGLRTTYLLHSIYLKELLFLRVKISNVLERTENGMTPFTSHQDLTHINMLPCLFHISAYGMIF